MVAHARLVLLGVCALTIALASAGRGAGATPERIVSMRNRTLSRERYVQLREEWRAYTGAHPRDALGWCQLARACRYSGVPCREYVRYAEKAVRLDPNNAEACATLGSYRWSTYCGAEPDDPGEAIRLLERALRLDPSLDDPHYILWVMRLSQGRRDEANAHLRALLDRGRMPEPLVDYAHNMLVGLDPDAILLTNGDNDTYPVVALQTARGFRTDVAVVNLSLLNLEWYRRGLRAGPPAVPVPLLQDADRDTVSKSPSERAVQGLLEALEREGWKRPLYVAVSVPGIDRLFPNGLSLEGLVYRVLPAPASGLTIDARRMSQNLDRLYRLESTRSLAVDWDSWSSLRWLMSNYCAAAAHLAPALAKAGDVAAARGKMTWAIEVLEFHHDSKTIRELIDGWSQWDPKAPELASWRQKYGR